MATLELVHAADAIADRPTRVDLQAEAAAARVADGLPVSAPSRHSWIDDVRGSRQPVLRRRVQLELGACVPGTHYRLVRHLGDGGMGMVFEAVHEGTDLRVALKVLRSEFSRSPRALEAFRREARATSRIGSDHIRQVYDFAELPDGRLVIAMELLEGCDLTREMSTPMDPGRVIGILRQVCRALASAHDAGLVHRDIKPENVFLLYGPRPDAVKVVDFGVSLILADASGYAAAAGTPFYVAPETIVHGQVSPAVDIYAVGCMAYEMLTGKLPIDGTTVTEVLDRHVEHEPIAPSRMRDAVPEPLDAVVMRCLAKFPGDRFTDMRDLEAALCEAQVEAGLSTPWDDLPLPEVDPERRDRLLRRMPEPEMVTSRVRRPVAWIVGAALLGLGGLGGWLLTSSRPIPEAPAQLSSEIEAAAGEARAAAAKAFWVYPPTDDPEHTTAYRVVRRLERMSDPEVEDAARAQATTLRAEFADTLERLGEEFWRAEGGKPFAVGYYRQALLFEPERATAQQRATFSERELAALETRASTGAFSEAELFEAEPLLVLAEHDPQLRSAKLAGYQQRVHARQQLIDQKLRRVTRSGAPDAAPLSVVPRPVVAPAGPPPADEPAPADEATPAEDRASVVRSKRSPEAAHALVQRAVAARRQGNIAEAVRLFEQALAKDSRDVDALAGLRDVYFERSEYGRAASYGARVVRRRPRSADDHLHLGDALYKVFRYEDAQRHYRRAQQLGASGAGWRLQKLEAKLAH